MKINGVELINVGRKRKPPEETKQPTVSQSSIDYPRVSSYNTELDIPKGMKVGDKAIMIAEVELRSYRKSEDDKGKVNIDLDFNITKAGFRDSKKKAADMSETELNESIEEEREKE